MGSYQQYFPMFYCLKGGVTHSGVVLLTRYVEGGSFIIQTSEKLLWLISEAS